MLETPNLTIRAMQPEDAVIADSCSKLYPSLLQLDPPIGRTRLPVYYSLLIKDTDEYIGICSLYNYNRLNREIELGIRIVKPDYWGKGYGSEVVNALCEFVFNDYSVTSVLAKTPVYNTRAIACYKKCGFTQYAQGTLDGYQMVFLVRREF